MLSQSVICEECGEKALVRGSGRVEFDWDNLGTASATPHIRSIRLTIDCPHCGVSVQDHYPDGRPTAPAGTPAQHFQRRLKSAFTAFRS